MSDNHGGQQYYIIDRPPPPPQNFFISTGLPSNTDNRKNVLKLGEGPIDNIKSSAGTAEKSFVLILVKQNQNFA